MENLFDADLSTVRVLIDPQLARASTRAFTRGEVIHAATADILAGTASGDELLGHELAHVVQQRAGRVGRADETGAADPDPSLEAEARREGERIGRGEEPERKGGPSGAVNKDASAQRAGPLVPVVVWGSKALAATAIDHFVDFAIAALLGLPGPGLLDDVVNFLINLVPVLSEAKKLKKIAKLFEVVDGVADFVRRMKVLNKPGVKRLLDNVVRESDHLRKALDDLDLDRAKGAFGRLLGHVREGQIAAKVGGESGENLIAAGMKKLSDGFDIGTDIDVVFKEGADAVFGQVKALNAARLTPGSKSWDDFVKQADRTVEGAAKYGVLEQVTTKVRYYVDDISDEARSMLEGKGIEVIMNATALK